MFGAGFNGGTRHRSTFGCARLLWCCRQGQLLRPFLLLLQPERNGEQNGATGDRHIRDVEDRKIPEAQISGPRKSTTPRSQRTRSYRLPIAPETTSEIELMRRKSRSEACLYRTVSRISARIVTGMKNHRESSLTRIPNAAPLLNASVSGTSPQAVMPVIERGQLGERPTFRHDIQHHDDRKVTAKLATWVAQCSCRNEDLTRKYRDPPAASMCPERFDADGRRASRRRQYARSTAPFVSRRFADHDKRRWSAKLQPVSLLDTPSRTLKLCISAAIPELVLSRPQRRVFRLDRFMPLRFARTWRAGWLLGILATVSGRQRCDARRPGAQASARVPRIRSVRVSRARESRATKRPTLGRGPDSLRPTRTRR